MIKLIKILSDINGVSGREDTVRKEIIKIIEGHCEYKTDNLGNLICFKKGKKTPKKTLMFSAHMDEVGFIITNINDDGLLGFTNVGGIDSRVVLGRTVIVGDNNITGIIGSKAIHMVTEKEIDTPYKFKDLFIDIGATTKEQTEKLINLGDRATFTPGFIEFGEDFIKNKALDDRAGCALLISLILQDKIEYDTNFVFTVNEETGQAGAGAAAYSLGAEIAVVVETTTAGDVAGVTEDKYVCNLSGGPVISFMDKGTIYDHELYKMSMKLAKKLEIPHQTKRGVYGGNESKSIQTSGKGVRVIAISLPTRYIHSPSCVLCKKDIKDTEILLKAMIKELGSI
ncbi:MAG: M42 family peptidase [Oscillospiraceae bacterium]